MGFGVWGLGFRVSGFGFRVSGSELRIWILGVCLEFDGCVFWVCFPRVVRILFPSEGEC